jgi:hypothetical protein
VVGYLNARVDSIEKQMEASRAKIAEILINN